MKEYKVYEWSHHIPSKHTYILMPKHMCLRVCRHIYTLR